ncbi:YebC/PmpR family DNA-binding transcriptional regulator [Caldinitratiruptor microaerophilus]|uniref:Probable transcriptional regulatory protein caldi_19020 n=1 Tax=Caldinitratiruptor microaerophilus TaxID=671077 RepID=A0AA35CKC2_9FIRM|nr:YebC/PmpR family DNA-binding transcriptional regulator [Caldinitratiruptor microaerophilus]BDG60812.1 putative transcriptional regulatory protein [Caldinitratiruptor microaerophilus]
MSGHSKWAQIKRTKAKNDAERGRLFSRLAKDILSAARAGGGNPDANLRLKVAIEKAREANMPVENIERLIARATGQAGGSAYEEVVYEGYGPGGVAILMEILTDNRNRTAADIRSIFNKHGGSLGESGSVAWMFARKGVIRVNRAENDITEDDLLAVVLDAGAEDLRAEDDAFEITTAPDDLDGVLRALERAGVKVEEGKVQRVPVTTVEVSGETARRLLRLLEVLDQNDDVQNVYANFDIPEGELAALEG